MVSHSSVCVPVSTGCLESTELLLMSGADPNGGLRGLTALGLQFLTGHDEIRLDSSNWDLSQSSIPHFLTAQRLLTNYNNNMASLSVPQNACLQNQKQSCAHDINNLGLIILYLPAHDHIYKINFQRKIFELLVQKS